MNPLEIALMLTVPNMPFPMHVCCFAHQGGVPLTPNSSCIVKHGISLAISIDDYTDCFRELAEYPIPDLLGVVIIVGVPV